MATFIFKTEPGEYSFDDLIRDQRTAWTGISNAQALINLRKAEVGDEVLIYETGSRKAIVGLARIVSGPTEDSKRPGATETGLPRFPVVEIAPVCRAETPVSLDKVRQSGRFDDLPLIRQPRLSVMLIPDAAARELKNLAGIKSASARGGGRAGSKSR